jgi:predicted Zn-dependent protease
MIDGIMYGQDPKEGFVENYTFYHPVLKLQFPIPRGWIYQNSPQSFQMAPEDGSALMMLTLARGQNLQEAASATMQQYKLTPIESKETSVNGLPALVVVADQQPQAQQQQQQQQQAVIRTLSYFISYGGNIYHLIGAAQSTRFNNYLDVFSATMQNFRQLTDQAIINRKPQRINVVTASGATLRDALKSKNIPDNLLEEHAILNGMKLADKISSGTLIKIIFRVNECYKKAISTLLPVCCCWLHDASATREGDHGEWPDLP